MCRNMSCVVPMRTPDVLGKQKRYRQTQKWQADSPVGNNISIKLCRPKHLRPAEYLPEDHRSFCTGILRRFHVTTSNSSGASRERTHLALHRIGKTDHVPRADSGGGGTRECLGEGAGGGEAGYGNHGSYCIDLVALIGFFMRSACRPSRTPKSF